MRLLLTTDTIGGVWTYALELARALQPHRIDVALATMGASLSTDQWSEVSGLSNLQVFESRYKLEWMNDPWEDVADAGQWLLELDRRIRPDVVHLNGFAHGALPWSAPVLMAAHSCVLSWWEAVKHEAAPREWDRYRREVGRGLRAAELVVAPTRAMLDATQHHYSPLRHTRVIHNGRSAEGLAPAEEKQPLILAAGRLWDEAKNVAAIASVARDLPWPVCVAGDQASPDGRSVEFANVKLLGKLSFEQLAPMYRRARIYALPARYEPFGLSALEAAITGCALVLGDIPSLREVWGDAAIFVSPEDPDALREALLALISNPSEVTRLADAAMRRAERYSPTRMGREYATCYAELVRERLGATSLACETSEETPCVS